MAKQSLQMCLFLACAAASISSTVCSSVVSSSLDSGDDNNGVSSGSPVDGMVCVGESTAADEMEEDAASRAMLADGMYYVY